MKELTDISEENRSTILKFKDYCLSEGIGVAKIERYYWRRNQILKDAGKNPKIASWAVRLEKEQKSSHI